MENTELTKLFKMFSPCPQCAHGEVVRRADKIAPLNKEDRLRGLPRVSVLFLIWF